MLAAAPALAIVTVNLLKSAWSEPHANSLEGSDFLLLGAHTEAPECRPYHRQMKSVQENQWGEHG
jgi:hypothetical protein